MAGSASQATSIGGEVRQMNISSILQKTRQRIERHLDHIAPCRQRLPWCYYWLLLYFSSHIRREEYLNDIADAHQDIRCADKLSAHFYLIKETMMGLFEVLIHHAKYTPVFILLPIVGQKICWYGYLAFDFLNSLFA